MVSKVTITTEEWVVSLPQEQTAKYTYEKAKYIGTDAELEITCPEHGSFWQRAYLHKYKNAGCSKCSDKNRGASQKYTAEQFIEAAKKRHGDKYDYSKVVYKNSLTKVIIRCHKHEDFEQFPNAHTAGSGCQKCFDDTRSSLRRSTTEKFVVKAQEVHGDKYSYGDTVYELARNKVSVLCNIHNKHFNITPDQHLRGGGCPICHPGGGYRTTKPGYLYVLTDGNITKVGITNLNPSERIKQSSVVVAL